jgi:hypothetical protein
MADQILPKGIRLFNKKDNQPDFVIGACVITMNELVQFAKDNPKLLSEYNGQKQLRLQVARSQAGNLYMSVDTWKPTQQPAGNLHTDNFSKSAPGPVDDLPF